MTTFTRMNVTKRFLKHLNAALMVRGTLMAEEKARTLERKITPTENVSPATTLIDSPDGEDNAGVEATLSIDVGDTIDDAIDGLELNTLV